MRFNIKKYGHGIYIFDTKDQSTYTVDVINGGFCIQKTVIPSSDKSDFWESSKSDTRFIELTLSNIGEILRDLDNYRSEQVSEDSIILYRSKGRSDVFSKYLISVMKDVYLDYFNDVHFYHNDSTYFILDSDTLEYLNDNPEYGISQDPVIREKLLSSSKELNLFDPDLTWFKTVRDMMRLKVNSGKVPVSYIDGMTYLTDPSGKLMNNPKLPRVKF